MTTKEYLQQIWRIEKKIDRLKRRREDLRADLYSIGSPSGNMDADRVSTSTSGDSMLRLIARVDELERDIVSETNYLVAKKKIICDQIEGMPNDRYREILSDRYVLCWRWEKIAIMTNLDIRWVYRLHGSALQAFHDQYSPFKASIDL